MVTGTHTKCIQSNPVTMKVIRYNEVHVYKMYFTAMLS